MLRAIREFLKNHTELRSLRLVVFAVIMVLGIVFGATLRHSFISNYEKNLIEKEESDILDEMQVLATHMISTNYLSASNSDVVNAEISMVADLYDGRVLVTDSDCKIIKDSDDTYVDSYISRDELEVCFGGGIISEVDEKSGYMKVGVPVEEHSLNDNSSSVIGIIYGLIPMESIYKDVQDMNKQVWTVEGILLVATLGIALIMAALISNPLIKLTRAIESVASFEEGAISVAGYQETDGIAKAFNTQRARLKTLDESRQEFVSNVSHELRTPITSMKVLADSLILMEDAPIEMYRDFMYDIVEEVDRENSIITDLLELVNMDRGKEGLKFKKTQIKQMLELIIKRLRPIANQNNIEIDLQADKNILAEIDESKMTLAITNLVENAIKYNVEGGWVRIVLTIDHQLVNLQIIDSGLGIPEDALPRIYERFYRVDKSHSKEIGGTGLGLAISRKIILLHRGSITANSEPQVGTTFTVKFPVQQN